MDVKQLAELVAEMRQAQRDYFKGRSGDELRRSKHLEHKVDQAVRDILHPEQKQPSLF